MLFLHRSQCVVLYLGLNLANCCKTGLIAGKVVTWSLDVIL